MKVIIDTNILVNILLSPSEKSASFKVIEMCLTGQLEPQIGCALFNEYEDVLFRCEIQSLSKYTTEEIHRGVIWQQSRIERLMRKKIS